MRTRIISLTRRYTTRCYSNQLRVQQMQEMQEEMVE
jgi:hypothetical protein